MKVIGRGSYAKVFVARLRRSGRVYAMKVIKKEAVSDDEVRCNCRLDEECIERAASSCDRNF